MQLTILNSVRKMLQKALEAKPKEPVVMVNIENAVTLLDELIKSLQPIIHRKGEEGEQLPGSDVENL